MSDRLSNEELARRFIERLRETCATCRHFSRSEVAAYCSKLDKDTYDGLPADGSGYCWQWERKA